MFTDQVIEIDLYTNLRKQRFTSPDECYATMEELWLYVPHPVGRSLALPLKSTKQRNGVRMQFVCHYCNHSVQKLYIHPRHVDGSQFPIACKTCHHLKYLSQYRKDKASKRDIAQYKLTKLESQKRRYWYGDYRTQFGRRYQKLREESKTHLEWIEEILRLTPEQLALFDPCSRQQLVDFRRKYGV